MRRLHSAKKFNFKVWFSENEDFNAAAYEAGGKAYINMSIATVMQLYHHILLLMGREELLPEAGKEEMIDGRYRIEDSNGQKSAGMTNNTADCILFRAG